MSEANKKPESEISEIEKRWTKPLIEAGWTAIPTVIFERQRAFGLDPIDVNIILHLAGYWWKAGVDPYPSKSTIAAALDVHPRTVQRRIAKLEGAGYIKRVGRKTKKGGTASNHYSLEGLIKEATPFAMARIEERQKNASAAKERAKGKTPKLKVVK